MVRGLSLTAALALVCVAVPAFGQSTYVTPAGTRVQGVVPLTCDTNGTNCAPNGSIGAPIPQIQGDVAAGVADGTGNPVKIGGPVINGVVAKTAGNRTAAQFNVYGQMLVAPLTAWASTDGVAASGVGQYYAPDASTLISTTANWNFNGTTWDRARGDVNGMAVEPALSATFWNYAAAAGGILNSTTAVTIKAAAGVGVRNYVAAMQCNSEAFTTASELAIRDGAAGTVIWRGKIPTTGWTSGREMTFNPPLKGTANTLTEIVTLTASGAGAVYCNLQGYTGV